MNPETDPDLVDFELLTRGLNPDPGGRMGDDEKREYVWHLRRILNECRTEMLKRGAWEAPTP